MVWNPHQQNLKSDINTVHRRLAERIFYDFSLSTSASVLVVRYLWDITRKLGDRSSTIALKKKKLERQTFHKQISKKIVELEICHIPRMSHLICVEDHITSYMCGRSGISGLSTLGKNIQQDLMRF